MGGTKQPLQRAAQACTACNRRKVRCDGLLPCHQCQNHSLPCNYASAPKTSRGRSRIGAAERGAVIAESRRGDPSTGTTPPAMGSTKALSSLLVNGTQSDVAGDADFFHGLIAPYMSRVYPLAPVLDEAELRINIANMDDDNESAALVYAFAAITLLLMQNDKSWSPHCYDQAFEMIALSIGKHAPLPLDSWPTLTRILSRVFLEMGLLVVHKHDYAFYYLRESTALILMHGQDGFLKDESVDPRERARRQRIYWLCFIHERHLCIEASREAYLEPLPTLPEVFDVSPTSAEQGWNFIIQTFMVLDRDFMRFWVKDRSMVTAEWVQKKHRELTDDLWQLQVTLLPINQQIDLIITRQWIRTLTWQLATSNALLSSDPNQSDGLSLFMPLCLSSELRGLLARMSSRDIEAHGIGIIEKLFEITTTIADAAVALLMGNYIEETRSGIHDLLVIKDVLLGLPHLKPLHREIVEGKMDHIAALCHGTSHQVEFFCEI